MRLKPGVRVLGLRPELLLALQIVEEVYEEFRQTFTITSIVEGTHSRASLHYTGCAADIRLPVASAPAVVAAAKERLGDDFDLILESDHLHLEFQPKAPY